MLTLNRTSSSGASVSGVTLRARGRGLVDECPQWQGPRTLRHTAREHLATAAPVLSIVTGADNAFLGSGSTTQARTNRHILAELRNHRACNERALLRPAAPNPQE
jgi:hypothetical protein